MVWTRPASVPFPSVWHTFRAKDVDSDQLVNYVVQDLPEDRFEEAINHMLGIFIHDEPMCHAKKLAEDPVSVQEIGEIWRELVKHRVALVCYREGSDEIAGLNMTFVSCKDDKKDYAPKGDRWQDVFDAVMYFSTKSNVFERYQVDEYLSAMGLSVMPKYRGRGLATEILRARIPLCKAVGLKLTSTVFTAIGSQIPAAKVGFEETFVMEYEELVKMNSRFEFPGIPGKYCKSMSLKID
ncbi:uncharacterized protein LOC134227318 [Armigeres subalbatus]|uniref:uncharacterized protein LOC134227318 n=2 Tax=Armigeres subalbatus TaxID=124917 RepID=UPI002ED67940